MFTRLGRVQLGVIMKNFHKNRGDKTMPVIEIVKLLVPFVHTFIKAKHGKIKESTGGTEAAQVGVIAAVTFIYNDIVKCGGFNLASIGCVSDQSWAFLGLAIGFLSTQAARKWKA